MDMDYIFAIGLICFCSICASWFIINCFIEPVYTHIKYKLKKDPIEKEISIEEVSKMLDQLDQQTQDEVFMNMINRYISGNPDTTTYISDNEFVEVLSPCGYHECSCHASREDCCTSYVSKDGKDYCRHYINLNKLCGIESHVDKVDILTDEECKIFYDYFEKFMKYLQEEGSKKQG